MTPTELIRARLKALCDTHGVATVADRIGSSPETLTQVIKEYKLPGGNARGLGPDLRRRLDGAYPGWAAVPDGPVTPIGLSEEAQRVANVLNLRSPTDQKRLADLLVPALINNFEISVSSRVISAPELSASQETLTRQPKKPRPPGK